MILPRGVATPLALLVAILTVTVTLDHGVAKLPTSFFGDGDTLVLGPLGGEVPGRGRVSTALVDPLRALPSVRAASPEIFVVTTLGGRSLFVRGVDVQPFLAIEHGALLTGTLPDHPGEALAGSAAAKEFNLRTGDSVTIASAFRRTAEPVRIVGTFAAPGPARDELLLRLDDARALTDLAAGEAHVIRIDAIDRDNVSRLLTSVAPAFTYSDVRLATTDIVAGETIEMNANLTNWGLVAGTKNVEARANGVLAASRTYLVPPRSTIPVQLDLSLTTPGETEVRINPTFHVLVRPALLELAAVPRVVVVGEPFTIRVTDRSGAPIANATIEMEGTSSTTAPDGSATLVVSNEGRVAIVAETNSSARTSTDTWAVLPEHRDEVIPSVESIEPPAKPIGENSTPLLNITVRDRGGLAGEAAVNLTVDGVVTQSAVVALQPGALARLSVTIKPLAPGDHVIGTQPPSVALTLHSYAGDDPELASLLEGLAKRGAQGEPPPSSPEDAQAYVNELLGNVATAVLGLSIAAAVLVAIGMVAVLTRHIKERARSLGTLKAIGASNKRALRVVTHEAAWLGTVAALAGVTLGVAIAGAIGALGWLRAFGHTVQPSHPWYLLFLVALLSTAFTVFAARAIAAALLASPIDHILRRGAPPPSLEEDVPTLAEALGERP